MNELSNKVNRIFFEFLQEEFKQAQERGHFIFWLPPNVQMGVLLKEIKEYFEYNNKSEKDIALTALAIIFSIRKSTIEEAIADAEKFAAELPEFESVSEMSETGEESRNSKGENRKASDLLDSSTPLQDGF